MNDSEIEIFCIIKFGQEKYIKELQAEGKVYMQRLDAYQKIEQEEIGDKNEGITHLFQADNISSFTINDRKTDIVGNVKIQLSDANNPFVFCTYALTEKEIDNETNHIDKRCLKFGDTALVITDFNLFLNRVEDALSQNSKMHADLIEYVDENIYHGDMGVLKKLNGYAHHNEYRIVVECEVKDKALMLAIGNIEDISYIVSTEVLLDTLKLDNIEKI